MKVAILTGGGDCPGLNAVIRAVVRRGEQHGFESVGVRDGWRGLLESNHFRLDREASPASCTSAARSSAPAGRTRSRTPTDRAA
jgi:6-phosphofructokinase